MNAVTIVDPFILYLFRIDHNPLESGKRTSKIQYTIMAKAFQRISDILGTAAGYSFTNPSTNINRALFCLTECLAKERDPF